jgi:hypothetical protein
LEKLRFGEKFKYEINIGAGISLNEQVPKMVLQTFAENAFKHGIMPSADGVSLFQTSTLIILHKFRNSSINACTMNKECHSKSTVVIKLPVLMLPRENIRKKYRSGGSRGTPIVRLTLSSLAGR